MNTAPQIITVYCKICAIEEGQYTAIVVEDLNRDYTDDLKYVTVIKLPNWGSSIMQVGDVGYLQFESIEGGVTQWFNKSSEDFEVYKYNNNYFINFFIQKDKNNMKEFSF